MLDLGNGAAKRSPEQTVDRDGGLMDELKQMAFHRSDS
jgi:hypothetical protein